MENFRAILKKRLVVTILYNAAILIFIGLSFVLGRKFALNDMAVGCACGFLVGIQLVIIFFMGKYIAAIRNGDKLKNLFIEENDERSKFIASHIGGTGIDIILGGLGLGTVIAGFFSQTVFITILATLLFSLLVKGVLMLYYNKVC